ncbi:MAG: response regulator transcription factor [Lysobacteraceae bacterium]
MIRLVLAEDQAMVRGALAALLGLESDLEVVAACADGDQAMASVLALQPDLLVTDIEMPSRTGLELAEALHAAGLPTRVVVITTFARSGYLRRAMQAGVRGYLLKDTPADRLAEALRVVHRGGRAIDPQLAAQAWDDIDPLNDRERQVLRLAGEGLKSADIADRLGLSHGTVRNYLSEAISKLGTENRIEAYRIARQRGFL